MLDSLIKISSNYYRNKVIGALKIKCVSVLNYFYRSVQNADCRLQTGYKMQTRYKMQTADCRLQSWTE